MNSEAKSAKFSSNAADVRRIAKGIYDQKERRIVLRFVAESVKLSKNASEAGILPAHVESLRCRPPQ